MKYCLFLLFATTAAMAQSTAAMYTTDLNGRRVEAAVQQMSRDGAQAEITQSINGRKVPLQQTETRVLEETPSGKVTETTIRKYDPNGQLAGTERVVSREQKTGDRTTIEATISRSDIHGRLVEAERRSIETVTNGATSVSDVNIARPSVNGTFESAEKRKIVTNVEGKVIQDTEAVLRPSLSGQFIEAVREVRETQLDNGRNVEKAAYYELDYTGKLQLTKQVASSSSKAADGSQVTEINIYGINSDGVPRSERAEMKIKEQQIVVRTPAGTGALVETTSVRRPTLADPSTLGGAVKISETTCTGKCDTPLPSGR